MELWFFLKFFIISLNHLIDIASFRTWPSDYDFTQSDQNSWKSDDSFFCYGIYGQSYTHTPRQYILLWIFQKIEMWVSSIYPPNLSLIGPITTEIYYWREKNWKHTNTHTDTQIETDTFPLYQVGSRKTWTGSTNTQTHTQTDPDTLFI